MNIVFFFTLIPFPEPGLFYFYEKNFSLLEQRLSSATSPHCNGKPVLWGQELNTDTSVYHVYGIRMLSFECYIANVADDLSPKRLYNSDISVYL